ncbi:MAG: aminotransferase class III-fold pyridoxal phosphate-dependent enzyme, partial [Armatimonadetes bacterium]|nr:aminotransferase class III-fold pyridoxal phosphate-dependent enzyme [Armatimonadota bacterium]
MTPETLEIAPALDAATPTDLEQAEPDAAHHLHSQNSVLDELAAADAQFGVQNYGQRLPVAFSHGIGVELWDFAGKRYLDFLAGIAVTQVGHAHPHVVEAIAQQAARVMHVTNYYYIAPQVELARRLSQLSYGFRAFFCNSGAEANEAALKLARKWHHDAGNDGKIEVVSVWKSFHGRTLGVLGATGNAAYHKGFAPLPPGHVLIELNDLAALENAIGEKTAAFLLEPILGESGILLPSPEFV